VARAAYLRECSGLSFGPSLRVKPPPRRGEWAQSRSPHFARAGGSRTLDLHRREPNRSPSDNLVAFPEGPTAPQRANGSAKAPVKTSPGPSLYTIPTAVALAVAAWAHAELSGGATNPTVSRDSSRGRSRRSNGSGWCRCGRSIFLCYP